MTMGERFPRYHILDTSVASDNVGDEVIMEATRDAMAPTLARAEITSSASHDGLGETGRALARRADAVLLFGSNALSPKLHVGKADIWRLGWRDLPALKGKVVLVGVGGRRDFARMGPVQRRVLRHILSPRHLHSVRDDIGLRIVEAAGRTAVNTSCSTLWRWRDAQPAAPARKAADVVFTLTRHKPAPEDRTMIDILRAAYERVFFWPQQIGDLEHLRALDVHGLAGIVPPNLRAYDAFLRETDVDYVGTRLHGGIHALSAGRRAVVIEIDNRAREISRDTGLPAVARAATATALGPMIESFFETRLALPRAAIDRFMGQFETGSAAPC